MAQRRAIDGELKRLLPADSAEERAALLHEFQQIDTGLKRLIA